MLTEKMINVVATIHNCIENHITEAVDQLIYQLENDAEEIGTYLLEEDILPQNKKGILYDEMLGWFVETCSYVENETDVESLISDELYDQLVEKIIDRGGHQQIGSPTSNIIGIDEKPHKFPELRGSLAKVHFLWDSEVPPKDSRKSLEHYLNNVKRQMISAGLTKFMDDIPVVVDVKYDGVSHIIEGKDLQIESVLTRGDVTTNMGKNLTPLFSKFFPSNDGRGRIDTDELIFGMNLPFLHDLSWNTKGNEFGIKVETYMPTNLYEKFKEEENVKRCNRRSAVTSICNRQADDVNRDMRKYLYMQNFQMSSTMPLSTITEVDREGNTWFSMGKINGRYQYFFTEAVSPIYINLNNIKDAVEQLGKEIENVRELARIENIPCDGAVITFLSDAIMELLGRKDNKNMFQVAFKFPAGEEKTTIEAVDFQVGPIAGRLTPVARLKPIKINGNTISNVTVSNKDKLERLNLHVGDEVIIRYDIIPSIFKTKDCKEVDTLRIKFPTICPICGGEVKDEVCTNPDCPSKIIGHILNYVKRLDIKGGIGLERIVQLVDAGFLESIGDLYRLYLHREELYKLPRMGELSVDNMLLGISDAKILYPHQILGSIGIPDIGLKTMEKVCKKINILGNLGDLDSLIDPMCTIPGIAPKSAKKIIDGIKAKTCLIEDICANVDVIPYGKEKEYETSVYLTYITDENFENYLDSINVKVADSFGKSTGYLIIPDEPMTKPSAKIPKAKKWGTPILKLSEAKEKWQYGIRRE